jgi:hypothetical protein
MQALFALSASQKIVVRNRSCPCVPFSGTRAEIKGSSFLVIESKYNKKFVFNDMTKACHVVEYKIQVSRRNDTDRQV